MKTWQKSLFGSLILLVVAGVGVMGWKISILTTENVRLASQYQSVDRFVQDHTASNTDTFDSTITSKGVHEYVNSERKKAGLAELAYEPKLEQSACLKADDMAAKDYWSHNAPDGTTPWAFFQKVPVYYRAAGENLAYNFKDDGAVVAAWMRSQKHKENILGDYTAEGICVRNIPQFQNSHATLVVQHFYKP